MIVAFVIEFTTIAQHSGRDVQYNYVLSPISLVEDDLDELKRNLLGLREGRGKGRGRR